MRDLILLLKIISGIDQDGICPEAGITDAQPTGLREAIYIIKKYLE